MSIAIVIRSGSPEIKYDLGSFNTYNVNAKDCYAFSGNVTGGVVGVTLNGQSLGIAGNMNYSDRYVMYIYHVGAVTTADSIYVGGRSGGIFYVE